MQSHSKLFSPHNPLAAPLAPYPSRNIRLSSALWAMQFLPRTMAEPATYVVDFETKKPVVTFWHEHLLPADAPVAVTFAKLDKILTATHVGMWWAEPGKYSIEGYDDALQSIRRVHERREWLIGVIKGRFRVSGDGRRQKGSVTTESLHVAATIMACRPKYEIPLMAFDRRTFVFPPEAGPIAALIHEASEGASASGPALAQRKSVETFGRDLCIDWMLAALTCRDRLMEFVRACIPMIEKTDGDRVLRVSSQKPKTLRREFTRRF
jgi:hypothetical protein